MLGTNRHSLAISGMAFIILGVFWLFAALTAQGTPYLVGPASISIVTAVVLLVGMNKSRELKILATSTALSNLVLTAYHAYAAALLFRVGLTYFGGVALAGYALGSIVLIILILGLYSDAQTR